MFKIYENIFPLRSAYNRKNIYKNLLNLLCTNFFTIMINELFLNLILNNEYYNKQLKSKIIKGYRQITKNYR